jgi:hypothetical protein
MSVEPRKIQLDQVEGACAIADACRLVSALSWCPREREFIHPFQCVVGDKDVSHTSVCTAKSNISGAG